jgi:hypothetical protein
MMGGGKGVEVVKLDGVKVWDEGREGRKIGWRWEGMN